MTDAIDLQDISFETSQLNYDKELQQLTLTEALMAQFSAKIDTLDEQQDRFILFRAKYQLGRLQEQHDALQGYIDHVNSNHDSIDPYPAYKDDLAANRATLDTRKSEYQTLYKGLKLISTDTKGTLLPVKQWHIDPTHIKPLDKPYYPQVTRPAATYQQADASQTVMVETREHNYSYTDFCYADDGTVLRNRFILYWTMDKDRWLETQSGTDAYYPKDLGVAYTNNVGMATELTMSSRILDNRATVDGDEYLHNRRYQLKDPVIPSYLNDPGDTPYLPYRLSGTNVRLHKATAFFLYPLDEGPFLTEQLSRIAALPLPPPLQGQSYASRVKGGNESGKIVAEAGSQQAPKDIYLHCTLPEWNHRLRRALTELQQQISEYNVISAPHRQKIAELNQLQELVDIHRQHAYYPSVDHKAIAPNPLAAVVSGMINNDWETTPGSTLRDKKELENRGKLVGALGDLQQGIQSIIDTPTVNNGATAPYYWEKQHIDECARELWELLKSEAFLAELQHYIVRVH